MPAELDRLVQMAAKQSLKARVLKKARWATNRHVRNDASVSGRQAGDHPRDLAVCLARGANPALAGRAPQQLPPLVPAVPARRGEGPGAAGIEAAAAREAGCPAGVRPDRPGGAGAARDVGPRDGPAVHRPGRLLRLRDSRVPAPQAIQPGLEPSLPAGHH